MTLYFSQIQFHVLEKVFLVKVQGGGPRVYPHLKKSEEYYIDTPQAN
jgi:hypothetical protein